MKVTKHTVESNYEASIVLRNKIEALVKTQGIVSEVNYIERIDINGKPNFHIIMECENPEASLRDAMILVNNDSRAIFVYSDFAGGSYDWQADYYNKPWFTIIFTY